MKTILLNICAGLVAVFLVLSPSMPEGRPVAGRCFTRKVDCVKFSQAAVPWTRDPILTPTLENCSKYKHISRCLTEFKDKCLVLVKLGKKQQAMYYLKVLFHLRNSCDLKRATADPAAINAELYRQKVEEDKGSFPEEHYHSEPPHHPHGHKSVTEEPLASVNPLEELERSEQQERLNSLSQEYGGIDAYGAPPGIGTGDAPGVAIGDAPGGVAIGGEHGYGGHHGWR